jgi:hypothetical protein
MQIEALPNSKLGTQEYWDSIYDREIDNYEQIGDEGEIWCVEKGKGHDSIGDAKTHVLSLRLFPDMARKGLVKKPCSAW